MAKIYYYVYCYERYLIIEVKESEKEQAEHVIDSAYTEWCNSDICECCEEYILSCLASSGIEYKETTEPHFFYYEEGAETLYSLEETKTLFRDLVDDTQKAQGTTFETWLDEMERMQILNRV